MKPHELSLTADERHALLMLHYGANGAATAMCNGSVTVGAVANMLASLAQGDVDGAKWALSALTLPGVQGDTEAP